MESSKPQTDDDKYNMRHTIRGIAAIINNENFLNISKRDGSDLDAKNLEETLRRLDFAVDVQTNLSASSMKTYFKKLAKTYPKDADCFLCVILTHGEETFYDYPNLTSRQKISVREDLIHGTDGPLPTRDIVVMFSDENCPALKEKPRFFFIQACRGQALDPGLMCQIVRKPEMAGKDVVDAMREPDYSALPPPCYKDALIVYSSPPGYYSFRRPNEGSWFIQTLCKVINQSDLTKTDFLRLLTRVMQQVGLSYESSSHIAEFNACKQAPCLYSMLTKDVFFPLKRKETAV